MVHDFSKIRNPYQYSLSKRSDFSLTFSTLQCKDLKSIQAFYLFETFLPFLCQENIPSFEISRTF